VRFCQTSSRHETERPYLRRTNNFAKKIIQKALLPNSSPLQAPGIMFLDMLSRRSISTAIMLLVTAAGPAVAALGPCCCSGQSAEREERPACCVQHERPESTPVHKCCLKREGSPSAETRTATNTIHLKWIAGCCCVQPVVATLASDANRGVLVHPDIAIAQATAPTLPREHVANEPTFFDPGLSFAIAPPLNVLNCVWLE
jgi:hypothetical protein